MIVNIENLPSDHNLDPYWKRLKEKNYDQSYNSIADWIRNKADGNQLSRRRNRRNNRFIRAWLFILPLLLLFSCAYRVNRAAAYGDLLAVDVHTAGPESIAQIEHVQKRWNIQFIEVYQDSSNTRASFAALIKKDEGKKLQGIKNDLLQVKGLDTIRMDPITYTINESLFSLALHSITDKHLDAQIPGTKALQREIESQLKESGIPNIILSITESGEMLLESTMQPATPVNKPDTLTTYSKEERGKNQIKSKTTTTKDSIGSSPTVDVANEYTVVKVYHRSEMLTKEELKHLDYLRTKLQGKINLLKFGWEAEPDLVGFFSSHDLEVTVRRADDILDLSGGKNMNVSTSGRSALLIFRYDKLVYLCPGSTCAEDAAIDFFQLKTKL